jgi:hypothetical protein
MAGTAQQWPGPNISSAPFSSEVLKADEEDYSIIRPA